MRRWIAPVIGATLIIVGLIGIAATAAIVHPAGWLTRDSQTGTAERERGRSRGDRAGGVDAMFIEQMVPHHEDAIAMAEVALENFEHPEIRDLAEDIIEEQGSENEQMRRWYGEWFDGSVPEDGSSDMMDRMMGGDVDLDEFAQAEPFDKAFIEQMIPHHRMGIMMARMVGSQTDEPEMRQLAEDIIDSQNEQIEQMQRWYAEWYGR